jgi:AcrR family transcriptional regulator
MKDQIKEIAVELLIRHGYQGFRFRDLADRLGTTRANIHYYYGSKLNLSEEVIVEYVQQTLANWEENWKSDKSFEDKIRGSLIGRMRMERDEIGPKARAALLEFGVVLEKLIVQGIERAIREGELSPEIPTRDIALQLVAIADSAGPITQDGGSFDRLEQLYLSFARIVNHAYGRKREPRRRSGQSHPPVARLRRTATAVRGEQ